MEWIKTKEYAKRIFLLILIMVVVVYDTGGMFLMIKICDVMTTPDGMMLIVVAFLILGIALMLLTVDILEACLGYEFNPKYDGYPAAYAFGTIHELPCIDNAVNYSESQIESAIYLQLTQQEVWFLYRLARRCMNPCAVLLPTQQFPYIGELSLAISRRTLRKILNELDCRKDTLVTLRFEVTQNYWGKEIPKKVWVASQREVAPARSKLLVDTRKMQYATALQYAADFFHDHPEFTKDVYLDVTKYVPED